MNRFLLLFVLFCSSCTSYKTPELPPLDAKPFSHKEIMEKQKALKQRTLSIQKENPEPAPMEQEPIQKK